MLIKFNLSRIKCTAILHLFCIFAPCFSFAQLKCRITHYSTQDGLSHDKVTSIIKDREGFMWFGTWDGINRFDGQTFTTFKSYAGDSSSLNSNRINDIVEDDNGYLWVKTDGNQVYRFDKRTGKFLYVLKRLKKVAGKRFSCTGILPSGKNLVWLLSSDQGLIALSKPGSPEPVITRYAQDQVGRFNLPSDKINFFRIDNQGKIWIGTVGGISILRPDASGYYSSKPLDLDVLNKCNFKSVAEDKVNIAFTTQDGYLIIHNKQNGRFLKKKILPDMQLNSVCLASKRDLVYCSTAKGELIILNKADLSLRATVRIDQHPILSILEDKSGCLWLEPSENGVFRYDPWRGNLRRFTQPDYSLINTGTPYEVFEDINGRVWVNMKGHGFGYYNEATGTIDRFYNDPRFDDYRFNNRVVHHFYDSEGILWLNTDQKGLEKVVILNDDFHQHLLVDHTYVQSENEVRALYSDHQQRLWIATKRKLSVFKGGKKIQGMFTNEPPGGLGWVYTICEDRKGNIWLGTKGKGLFKAEPLDQNHTRYRLAQYTNDPKDTTSISGNAVYSVVEDEKGRIWTGTIGGGLNQVVSIKGKTKFYNIRNGFSNHPRGAYNGVRHLAIGPKGNIWVGTTDGLLIVDATDEQPQDYRFFEYNKIPGDPQSLGNNDIQFILKDRQQRMWLCTAGGGFDRAVGKDSQKGLKFRNYTIGDGLANDFTLSCVEDNFGKIWLATQKGLSQFDPEIQHFKNYYAIEGLPKFGFSESACLKQPCGNIVFGEFQGYLSFNPAMISHHKTNAHIAITGLQVNGRDIDISDHKQSVLKSDINYLTELVLKYDEDDLSFTFNVLDYRNGDRQNYAYRLLGMDSVWIQSDPNQRKATYSNLPPGSYIFQVKTVGQDQYLEVPFKQLSVKILPPPWRTGWAKIAYILFIAVLLRMTWRIISTMFKLRQRIQVEQELTELKLNFFTNISHELRTPLTLIMSPVEALLSKEDLSERGRRYIEIIKRNTERMERFVSQLLDLRKVQTGNAQLNISRVSLVSLIDKVAGYFTEAFREKNIRFSIVPDNLVLEICADPEKMETVFYNILANALKYSPQDGVIEISVNFKENGSVCAIAIRDEGPGVDETQLTDIFRLYYEGQIGGAGQLKGTGIGLSVSSEFVRLHGGKIYAENSADTNGLIVTIELGTSLELCQFQKKPGTMRTQTAISEVKSPEQDTTEKGRAQETGYKVLKAPLLLLVDDNSDLRVFLSGELGGHYRIELAENGEEGFSKAMHLYPDLIISDVMMPVMDGITMLDKLKSHNETSHIPVILLTAKASVENKIDALNFGADQYLTKPFRTEMLLAAVSNLLEQRNRMFWQLFNRPNSAQKERGDLLITSHDELFLNKIIQFISAEMSDPSLSIESMAANANMSRSPFYRKFKGLTNMAPVEFLREMRLRKAKILFDSGEQSITEVAYRVGFESQAYFSTCFKHYSGQNPSEYIKNLQ
ncbi:signal transduction histidine kinase [Mucilaginibacter gracilis]|uniref:histidine kinase n=2 Tax=Mucilaginibacter TaxID=423349 RepID=H1YH34_9SPHI|nr:MULTISPECIES: hybrid sensor histidine kinase/response regulator transcription factor [Mucilaginibacter]EHQ27443.1 histidine kinase [Mucilaginibacter paludis DSM 18603]RKR81010.1 signal transduction histidine kinase [Mucilaginibacter gracilis]